MAATVNRNPQQVLAPNERNERNERKSRAKQQIPGPKTPLDPEICRIRRQTTEQLKQAREIQGRHYAKLRLDKRSRVGYTTNAN
jgi:hypothetical protein